MYKIKKDLKDKVKLLKISTKDCKAYLKFDDLDTNGLYCVNPYLYTFLSSENRGGLSIVHDGL